MNECSFEKDIISDPELQKIIIDVYNESFASSDNECGQDQICYDDKSLTEALLDPEYIKILLYAGDSVIGLSLLTNNLRKARIAYCNDRFLAKRFPHYVREGKLYYVTCICILPEMQKQGMGLELLKSIIQFIHRNHAMVAYDFSENKNPNLTSLIQYVGKTQDMNLIEIPLDRQHYTTLHGEHYGTPN